MTLKKLLGRVGILAAALIALLVFSSVARAEVYVGAHVGFATGSEIEGIALNDDSTFGANVGYDFGHWRLEGGVDRVSADTAPFSLHAMDYSASAFFDIPVSGNTEAFVGAGVDYVNGEVEFGPFSASESGGGYHYGGGLAHKFDARWTGQVEARHIEADLDGLDVSSNTFTIGARRSF